MDYYTKIDSKTGIVFEITDSFVDYGVNGNPENVKIEICYSGNSDENGNEIAEFEYATANRKANPHLTNDQIMEINMVLDNGRELDYVKSTIEFYKLTGINFDAKWINFLRENNL